LLRIQDLVSNRVADGGFHYISRQLDAEFHRSRLKGGEVLLSIQGTIGRTALVPARLAQANISRTLAVIQPDDSVIAAFLYFYFQYLASTQAYETGGTTRASLNISTIREMTLPVPPRAEQERIVAAIEEQFSRIDAGVAPLDRVRQNLRRMRATVLERPYERIPADKWVPLMSVGRIVTGNTPDTKIPANYGGDLPFVTPTDFNHGDRVTAAPRGLTDRGRNRARSLPQGAVLATCIGATLGKVALADAPCATNQQINAVCPNEEVTPAYLFYCLLRPSFTRAMWRAASSTTMPIINKSRFSRLTVPVVPAGHQGAIVAEIEEGLQRVDHLVLEVDTAFARTASLRSAILASAFSGKLVPQDPSEQPATALLETIAAERASSNGYKTTPGSKPRTPGPKVLA